MRHRSCGWLEEDAAGIDRRADGFAIDELATDADVALAIEGNVSLVSVEGEAMPLSAGVGFGDLVTRDWVAVTAGLGAIAAERRVVVVDQPERDEEQERFHGWAVSSASV